jgi:capsular polysaccharide biosynthesis protein
MEVRQLVKLLLRRWWLVALPVFIVATYLEVTTPPPAASYLTTMSFAVGTEPSLSVDYDRYYSWLTSEYIANALKDIARTQVFAQAVTTRLSEQNLNVDPGILQGRLRSDSAQSVVWIYLQWPDAGQSISIAEAVSAELIENGPIYFPQLESGSFPARRLDTPHPVLVVPDLRSRLLNLGPKLLWVVAVSLGLVLLNHCFDPFIHSQDDIESLSIAVVGAIPHVVSKTMGDGE